MNSHPKILIVDDEKDLCEILEFNLRSEGFEVEVCYSAEEALKKNLKKFDLILLDVMMAGISGFKMTDIIRKELKLDLPVVFLTAKNTENNILTGFNVGGDDYISKPFSLKEVIARIKAILKRGKYDSLHNPVLTAGTLSLDTSKKIVTIDGKMVELTRKEFEILGLLLKRKGQYVSRDDILGKAWDENVIVTERNVDVNIARLRKKIGSYGKFLKGRSGFGYCFDF